jgi:hypothetical protein
MDASLRRPIHPFIQKSNYPVSCLGCGGLAAGNKKPTAVASRGFLLNYFV